MKTTPTNCPRCNSLQRFAPRKRVASGMIQTYIKCRACGWEKVVSAVAGSQERRQRLMQRRKTARIARKIR